MNKIKVAVLKETKTPPDRRTALAPEQAAELTKKFPNVELFVQSSDIRAFRDEEYIEKGITVTDDISHCDILIGVKEVEISQLTSGKTYLFFSHTGKKQSYNRVLLQQILKKKIRLIDHEYLTDRKGIRLVAFGRWAGVVGTYNSMIAFGLRNKAYHLKRAVDCRDLKEMTAELEKINLPSLKILITGGGRVANGAIEIMHAMKIKQISPEDFLTQTYKETVFSQLDPQHYVQREDGNEFNLTHFFESPQMYKSVFEKFTKVTDIYLACHFWNEKSPVFISSRDLESPEFNISIIADISCDINGPIASTVRASKIDDPFYGYDCRKHIEVDPFNSGCLTVMAVDNLPGEVPRDASVDFGKDLINKVFPSLFNTDSEKIIERATITTSNGKLGKHFQYLKKFAAGKE
jgi:alanine dehydrogenase